MEEQKQISFELKVTRLSGESMDAKAYAVLIAEVNRRLVDAAREAVSAMAQTGHVSLDMISVKVSTLPVNNPKDFPDIFNADSLTLILWYNTVTDRTLSDSIEAEMTHRDLDGDKGSECIWLEKYSKPTTK